MWKYRDLESNSDRSPSDKNFHDLTRTKLPNRVNSSRITISC